MSDFKLNDWLTLTAPETTAQPYYVSLGRFMDSFSALETTLHVVLRTYARITGPTARALFSGVRANETRDRLRRLYESGVMREVDWNALDPVLAQVSEINKLRNNIVHHGADIDAGTVSNEWVAHTSEKIAAHPISPEILDQMTMDVRRITVLPLTRHCGRQVTDRLSPETERLLYEPWLYRPVSSRLAQTRKPKRPGSSVSQAHQSQLKRPPE